MPFRFGYLYDQGQCMTMEAGVEWRIDKRNFKSFDGTRLAYYDDGNEGTPAILLHGLPSRASDLADVAECTQARGVRAIALDFRAHGDSDAPRDPNAYRDQALARDEHTTAGRDPALAMAAADFLAASR